MAKQRAAKQTATKRPASPGVKKRTVKKPASVAAKPRRPKARASGRATSKVSTPKVKQGRVDALTQVFSALGAQRPATWARSHVEGGYDELGRFVLLRALWLKTVEPGRLLGLARNERAVSTAVDRLLKNADLADLDAIVRFAQKQALLDLCSVLDDPSASDEGIGWAVFRTDGRGLPLWTLDRLAAGLTDSEPR